jgi:hypothetical protein
MPFTDYGCGHIGVRIPTHNISFCLELKVFPLSSDGSSITPALCAAQYRPIVFLAISFDAPSCSRVNLTRANVCIKEK